MFSGAITAAACGGPSQDFSDKDVTKSQRTTLEKKSHYSPYVEQAFPKNVYFGDTHLHTSYSFDAGMVGDRLNPDQAYRFAKGEVVIASLGAKAKLSRPLDFLVIADHAESLGIAPMIAENNPIVLNDPDGEKLYELSKGDDPIAAYRLFAKIRGNNRQAPFA